MSFSLSVFVLFSRAKFNNVSPILLYKEFKSFSSLKFNSISIPYEFGDIVKMGSIESDSLNALNLLLSLSLFITILGVLSIIECLLF